MCSVSDLNEDMHQQCQGVLLGKAVTLKARWLCKDAKFRPRHSPTTNEIAKFKSLCKIHSHFGISPKQLSICEDVPKIIRSLLTAPINFAKMLRVSPLLGLEVI